MGNVVTATLEVQFVDPDLVGADGFPLQLLLEEGIIIGNDRFLRLYPSVNAIIRVSVGSITKLGTHVETIETENVQFNGSLTASTRFPVAQLLNVDTYGSTFDKDGNIISVSFTAKNGVIEASQEVFGSIIVDYNTTYRRLRYIPVSEELPSGAISITLGTVLAFFNASVATFEVQPSAFPDIEEFELYAIESKTVVQELTVFEFPPGFPDDPTFPQLPGSSNIPDPNESFIVVRRFHEIGYITASGSFTSREFFVRNENPFIGNFTFKPVLELTVATDLPPDLATSSSATNALDRAQTKVNKESG